MAVGVQAATDLVLKMCVSIITVAPSPPSLPPRPLPLAPCMTAAPAPITCQLRFGSWERQPGSCWHVGVGSWALELASTICTLIHLFNLTILYQPERIIMHKLLFQLAACLPLTKPHAGPQLLAGVILTGLCPLAPPWAPSLCPR